MHSIETLLNAYAALPEAGAGALDREAEQRLQALLADGVLPLLLRCLKAWKAGARPLQPKAPPAHLAAHDAAAPGCARRCSAACSQDSSRLPGCARCCCATWRRGTPVHAPACARPAAQGASAAGLWLGLPCARVRQAIGVLCRCCADECTLQRLPSASAVLRGGPVLEGSPGARPAAYRPAVLAAGQRQGPDASAPRGRAGQAADLQAPVQARAAEGAHARRALPVHPAAGGVAACGGAGARQRGAGAHRRRAGLAQCSAPMPAPACAASLTAASAPLCGQTHAVLRSARQARPWLPTCALPACAHGMRACARR